MDDDSFLHQIPWYKTAGGITFLGILSTLFFGFLLFGGFVTYYAYQIKQGNGSEIVQKINASKNFSTASGTVSGQITNTIDPTPYIRPHNPKYGNSASPVTIIAFIDFECPYCQESFSTFEEIREQYGSGVHIIFKHFPLATIHPFATRAGFAAACADEQNAFWPYYIDLFETKALSKDALLQSADTVGLNTTLFKTCLESEKYSRNISQDIQDGINLGVRGTPTYFINSKKLEGVVPKKIWDTEIIHALQNK